MIQLDDLFDPIDLEQAIDAGYVRTQVHPTLPYVIYNYTEKAAFERAWTPVTLQCRGLIAHRDTREVLARPFPKFFNHSESSAPNIPLDSMVCVTDKMDGSLGILYPTGDGEYAIATRGSFTSDQAIHATAVWRERYSDTVHVPVGTTLLFEIIYRANRIVVDYGDLDDLVLLDGIRIGSGASWIVPTLLASAASWPGPVTEVFGYLTFTDALAAEPRAGREGMVVYSLDTGDRVKLKQDDYVYLHRIVTGMNERVVWEHLGAGKHLDELLEPLPEEFRPWVEQVAERLASEALAAFALASAKHEAALAELRDEIGEDWTRRDYAELAMKRGGESRPWMFNLLDGRDPGPAIWKTLRPAGNLTMATGAAA